MRSVLKAANGLPFNRGSESNRTATIGANAGARRVYVWAGTSFSLFSLEGIKRVKLSLCELSSGTPLRFYLLHRRCAIARICKPG
jgi:hypothetical protein